MRLIDADKLDYELKIALKNYEHPVAMVASMTVANAPTVDLWHYPSKGELPKEDGRYLAMCYDYVSNSLYADLLWFENKTWHHRLYKGNYDFAVRAWQYIIPPKEEA